MTVGIRKTEKDPMPVWQPLSGIVIAFLLAMLITALIIFISGKNPIEAFYYIYKGAFSNVYFLGETIIKTCPLLIGALGLCVCYRAGMTSIGAEGQMAIGGLMAAICGIYCTGLPPSVHRSISLLFAMLGGAVWAGIAGYLKATKGVSEVINTIMLNYVAIYLVLFMCSGPIQEKSGAYIQTDLLLESSYLTLLVNGTRIHSGVLIAPVVIVFVYFLLWKSPMGYQMRAVGYNPIAAQTNGISVKQNFIFSMAVSGALCGLAGGIEIIGIHHRLMPGFTSELGFDAMAIALLGGLHPVGITLASLFFGALRAGVTTMQRAVQIPVALVDVIQGLVLILVLAQSVFGNYLLKITTSRKKWRNVRYGNGN